MDFAGLNWATMTIAGVLILAAVLVWVSRRNQGSSGQADDTEAATRRVYEEEDREHRGESDHVP